ncbi:hypothetical protein [Halorientalis litorea]|uniref:hypothetical protein n=1 Tax=Halorientalis litorea TaxID=2931977 RepID=UPI001FF47071|nr:hypothetical protein [Halorientalis litorea]
MPGPDEFTEDPVEYLGDRVVLGGYVQSVDPTAIRVQTTTGPHEIDITGRDWRNLERGDKIRVYGVLASENSIRVIHAFAVPNENLWYTWGISLFAGIWVFTRFIRHWKINRETLHFCERTPEPAYANKKVEGEDNA